MNTRTIGGIFGAVTAATLLAGCTTENTIIVSGDEAYCTIHTPSSDNTRGRIHIIDAEMPEIVIDSYSATYPFNKEAGRLDRNILESSYTHLKTATANLEEGICTVSHTSYSNNYVLPPARTRTHYQYRLKMD